MYNMYPWDQLTDASDDAARATQAVQVALDRRDNGGDVSKTLGSRAARGPELAVRRPRRPIGQ